MNNIASYTKKPVTIQAIQVENTEERIKEIIMFTNETAYLNKYSTELEILIPTLEGIMTAKIGDWVIKGIKGEFYPCKDDIFKATYNNANTVSPRDIITTIEGASYLIPTYKISNKGLEFVKPFRIDFVKGSSNAEVFNQEGVTLESLLELCRVQLNSVNVGQLATRESSLATTNIELALMWLNQRRVDREKRGVITTHLK